MQCRYKVTVPNFTQVSEVRHVDNPCISLVLECRLQPRQGTAMLANVPPGDYMKLAASGLKKKKGHTKIGERCKFSILKRPLS